MSARRAASPQRRAALVLLAAAPVLAGLAVPLTAALRLPEVTGTAVVDAVELVVSVAAAVVCAARAAVKLRRRRAARRSGAVPRPVHLALGWAVLAVACASWAWGQALWSVSEVLAGVPAPQATLADAGFLGFAALAPVAGALLARGSGRTGWQLRAVLDGLIIAAALLLVAWLVVLRPLLVDGTATPLQVVLNSASPVGDLVLLAVLVALVARSTPTAPLVLLTCAATAMALADTGYAYLGSAGDFASGGVLDVLWTAAFVLVAAAATVRAPVLPRSRDADPGLLSLALPYLPFLGAVAATAAVGADRPLELADWVPVASLGALVMARQALLLVDHLALSRELNAQAAALTALAYADPLTGVANRAALTRELERATSQPAPVVLAFCDLDAFKAVNDVCGHATGDALLVAVARRLREVVREEDVVARLGGDEFAVLVVGGPDVAADDAVTGDRAGEQLGARLRAALSVPFAHDPLLAAAASTPSGAAVVEAVSVSIGVVSSADLGRPTAEELLHAADQRMYDAKRGRADVRR